MLTLADNIKATKRNRIFVILLQKHAQCKKLELRLQYWNQINISFWGDGLESVVAVAVPNIQVHVYCLNHHSHAYPTPVWSSTLQLVYALSLERAGETETWVLLSGPISLLQYHKRLMINRVKTGLGPAAHYGSISHLRTQPRHLYIKPARLAVIAITTLSLLSALRQRQALGGPIICALPACRVLHLAWKHMRVTSL